jgi:hypothetical protein
MSTTTFGLYAYAILSLIGVMLHLVALGVYELECRSSYRYFGQGFNLSEKAHMASVVVLLGASVDGCVLLLLYAKQMAGG